MKASDLASVLSIMVAGKRPVLVTGAPGIGKSDLVASVAGNTGADLVIMHPVVSDPTDYKGLPGIVDGAAEFLPYGELRKIQHADRLTICFLDDIGQAAPSVQAALMQLLLAREINGVKISDHVTFIAATNRREDRAGVGGMLEPVKSRFTGGIVNLEVDVEDWINWALSADLPIEVIAFVKFKPAMLHDFKATADLINSPCPRTVAAVGKAFELGIPQQLEFEVYKGIAGEGFASEFLAFVKIMRQLPNADEILLDPDSVPMPEDPAVLYALSGSLARKASETTMERILKFADRMPPEFQVLLIRDAVKRDRKCTHTKAYIQWAQKNASVLI
jgi:hypothetical protein